MNVYITNDAWKMTIDLTYVCENAGKRDRWYDERGNAHSYIPFTLVHARKIFRLIKQYAGEGNFINAMLYIKRHSRETGDKRILEQWEKA